MPTPSVFRALLAAALVLALPVFAQDAPPPAKKLTVLVKPAPPFAFQENGDWRGYSIDLWRRVAQEAHFDFEFQPAATIPAVVDSLVARQADVGVGALSITFERQAVIDFSQGFYRSGLRILVQPRGQSSFWAALRPVFTPGVLGVIGILIAALIVNAHLIWFLERRRNPESFPDTYPHGPWQALWWSTSTIITGGCENIAPATVPGRLVAIVWMLGCIGLTSFITANLSANLTTDRLTSDIKSFSDLAALPTGATGTVKGSAAATYLERQHLTFAAFDDINALGDAVVAGKIRAAVYDEPLLLYYTTTHDTSKLQLVGDPRERQSYGFALQDGSPYRKEINRALLKISEEGFDDELDKKWFTPPKD